MKILRPYGEIFKLNKHEVTICTLCHLLNQIRDGPGVKSDILILIISTHIRSKTVQCCLQNRTTVSQVWLFGVMTIWLAVWLKCVKNNMHNSVKSSLDIILTIHKTSTLINSFEEAEIILHSCIFFFFFNYLRMNFSLVQTSGKEGLWDSDGAVFLHLGMKTEVTNGFISMNHEEKTPKRD